MKIIGITGGIATGKSTVTNKIKEFGYKVIDCDKISHQLLEDVDVISAIESLFGKKTISDGKVNRRVLGEVIFNDPAEQIKLNNLIHPLVIEVVKAELEQLDEEIVFIDCPLLYEAQMEDMMDKVITIYINEDLQIQRLMKRDSISQDYAMKKIQSQLMISEKIELADYLINNESEEDTTTQQLLDIIRRIRNEI